MIKFIKIGFLLLFFNQIIFSQDSIPKYFPDFSFDCNSKYDQVGNSYWSSWLKVFNKPVIYNDSLYSNFFRLVYFGNYLCIVSLQKISNDYVLVTDSLNWQSNNVIENREILYSENDLKIVDSLMLLGPYLNKYRSYENCTNENLMMIDDRDTWVIESKINGCYHVIKRTEPEKEISKFIVLIMQVAKSSGYKIYRDLNTYDKY